MIRARGRPAIGRPCCVLAGYPVDSYQVVLRSNVYRVVSIRFIRMHTRGRLLLYAQDVQP